MSVNFFQIDMVSIRIGPFKIFCLFYTKNLLFLFYTITFPKHLHQIIYPKNLFQYNIHFSSILLLFQPFLSTSLSQLLPLATATTTTRHIIPYQTCWSRPQIVTYTHNNTNNKSKEISNQIHQTHLNFRFTKPKYIWNQNPNQSHASNIKS